jgi:hypothetical protein
VATWCTFESRRSSQKLLETMMCWQHATTLTLTATGLKILGKCPFCSCEGGGGGDYKGLKLQYIQPAQYTGSSERHSTHLRVPPFADRKDRCSACCTNLVLFVLEASLEALKAISMGTVLWSHWLLAHFCKNTNHSFSTTTTLQNVQERISRIANVGD